MARSLPTADPVAVAAAADAAAPAPPTAAARLRRALASPYLTLASRLVLGGIFLLSGLTKLGA
ncbi:MAG TPA: hypothetical protein VKY74_11505, partial [Chloroflexia bacterium]|nr:hypothetical protein [Chloroflexia bacterium]